MKPADIQSFLPQKTQRLRTVEEPKRQQLVQATYDVVGCLHDVYRQLGPGLPEYIYQEALAKSFTAKGLSFTKEQEFHPLFMGNLWRRTSRWISSWTHLSARSSLNAKPSPSSPRGSITKLLAICEPRSTR